MENNPEHVCPWWVGYLLASPIRKIMQNPKKILKTYIKEGMTILDFGSAMGFFSLPMAELAGKTGKVVCVDLQIKMLDSLQKRAVKQNLADRIETRQCTQDSLMINDLKGKIDFALAFAVMHETPDQKKVFVQIYDSLKKGGTLFIAEPAGHVSKDAFAITLSLALEAGFKFAYNPKTNRSFSAILKK